MRQGEKRASLGARQLTHQRDLSFAFHFDLEGRGACWGDTVQLQLQCRHVRWATSGVCMHLIAQVVKDANLYEGLLVEALLVLDDLQSAHLPCLVVPALQHLPIPTPSVSPRIARHRHVLEEAVMPCVQA